MVVGSMLVGDVPAPDAPEQAVVDYLADSGAHTRNIIGACLWIVGAFAFLWFLTRRRSDLRRVEGGTGPSPTWPSVAAWPSPQSGWSQRPSSRRSCRSFPPCPLATSTS